MKEKYSKSLFSKTITVAARLVRLKDKNIGLSVNIVGKNKIGALNKKYRSQNKPTDVLSFPVNNQKGIARSRPANAILELGDIFICPQIAGRNREKLSWLTVHGFLHLLGYDHEKSAAQRRKMFALQKKIFADLGF